MVVCVALAVAGSLLGGESVDLGGGEDRCEAALDHVRDLYRAEVRAREEAEMALSSCRSDLSSCESDLSYCE